MHVGLACGARRGGCFSACQFFKCLILFKYSQVKRRRLRLNHLGCTQTLFLLKGSLWWGCGWRFCSFFLSCSLGCVVSVTRGGAARWKHSQGFHVAELPCDAEGSLLKKYLWGNRFFFFLYRYYVRLIYLISIALFCINLNLAAALVLKKSVSPSGQNESLGTDFRNELPRVILGTPGAKAVTKLSAAAFAAAAPSQAMYLCREMCPAESLAGRDQAQPVHVPP